MAHLAFRKARPIIVLQVLRCATGYFRPKADVFVSPSPGKRLVLPVPPGQSIETNGERVIRDFHFFVVARDQVPAPDGNMFRINQVE